MPYEKIDCPKCGVEMELWESIFQNELGEAEYRGYSCPNCGYTIRGS